MAEWVVEMGTFLLQTTLIMGGRRAIADHRYAQQRDWRTWHEAACRVAQ